MKRASCFILFLLMAVSCLDQPDCFRQTINLMGLSFKKIVGSKADTVNVSIVADGVAKFYDGVLSTGVSLPLDYLDKQTSFSFLIREKEYLNDEEKTYSLVLGHDSKPQFVSEECGQRFVVSNLKINATTFDSVNIISTSLSNPAHSNITIYQCPRTNIVRLSFRQLLTDKVSRGQLQAIEIDSVSTPTNGLYTKGEQSSVLLPLDKTTASSTFNFSFTNGEKNVLVLNYDVEPVVLASKCGEQKLLYNLKATSDFANLRVIQTTVQSPPVTNVEVYRCPVTNTIKMLFKELKGNSKVTKQVVVKSVKTDYAVNDIYTNKTMSDVVLPLNPDPTKTATTFTFEFEGGDVRKLQVGYTVVGQIFHADCGAQPVFTNIKILATDKDFIQTPTVLDTEAKFPTASNIETIL